MARRELGAASLAVAQAVAAVLPTGPVVVGVSGGADSMALAMGAQWAALRCDAQVLCVVVDHGLQPQSGDVARGVVEQLFSRDVPAEVRRVTIAADAKVGMEASAREQRLACLAADGVPVLLGHTLDDQAESVLLALLRGSGTRSLAGMAAKRDLFLRPLLTLRRATTEAACTEWGVEIWNDPHNADGRFRRVRARRHLEELSDNLGQDVAPALARSATLARMDADLLDRLAAEAVVHVDLSKDLSVADVGELPDALRLRCVRAWLLARSVSPLAMSHVTAVDALLSQWRGQGPVAVPEGTVRRAGGFLRFAS